MSLSEGAREKRDSLHNSNRKEKNEKQFRIARENYTGVLSEKLSPVFDLMSHLNQQSSDIIDRVNEIKDQLKTWGPKIEEKIDSLVDKDQVRETDEIILNLDKKITILDNKSDEIGPIETSRKTWVQQENHTGTTSPICSVFD